MDEDFNDCTSWPPIHIFSVRTVQGGHDSLSAWQL